MISEECVVEMCRVTYEQLMVFRVSECHTCSLVLARRMASSGMLRRMALVRTDVSEELTASFFRVTRIGELATTLAVTSN
jgi:hypothetical protein